MDRIVSPPKKTRKKLAFGVGFFSIFSLLSAYVLTGGQTFSVSKDSVVVKSVRQGPLEISVIGNGTIVPREIDYIIPKSSGELESVNVKSGDRVKQGQVLFVIKNEELLVEHGSKEIALAEAKALMASTEFELHTKRLEIEKATLQAKSAYSIQEQEYLANKTLFETDNPPISKLKYRQSEIKTSELKEVYELEKIRLSNFDNSVESQLHRFQAQIDLAQNLFDRVNAKIDGLNLRARRDGVIQDVEVKPGQRVEIGAILGQVYDPNEIYVRLKVSATQGHRLKVDQEAEVNVNSEKLNGRVVRIDPNVKGTTIDADIELFDVESLRSNMFVSGKIIVEKVESTLFVDAPPNTLENGTASFYLVTEKGRYARRVKVATGFLSSGLIQIKEGLSAGDEVVISGSERFDGNLRVKLK